MTGGAAVSAGERVEAPSPRVLCLLSARSTWPTSLGYRHALERSRFGWWQQRGMLRKCNIRVAGLNTLPHPGRDLSTAGDLEPRPDTLCVRRHRRWRHTEPACDGVIFQPLSDESGNLALARRQACVGSRPVLHATRSMRIHWPALHPECRLPMRQHAV